MMTTSAPQRHRLPNRRPCETRMLEAAGQVFEATVGFNLADGRPLEIFLSGAKDGTEMAAILDDTSVVVSIALQHGVTATVLAKSVARIPATPLASTDFVTAPASVIGAVLDLLREYETQGE